MIHVDAAFQFTSGSVGDLIAIGALLAVVFTTTRTSSRDRRADKRIVADKDKTALEQIAASATEANTKADQVLLVLQGRPVTRLEPNPPPGLVEVVYQHGKMLTKMLPNGGNTDNPGDLLLKLARDAGVTEDGK